MKRDTSEETLDNAKRFLAADDEDDEPGEQARPSFARYPIVREIARGGMAVVYEARDLDLGRTVALKVPRDGTSARLRGEAMAAAKLRHPNIVTIHDVGPNFIAMELVPGRTFAETMPEMGRDDRLRTLEIVARAVGYAHAQGIVHRDIKPDNVLIDPDGRVVLTDFGLARISEEGGGTRAGAVLGTPHYMAPEQVRGETVGPACDVWALGVILHEILSDARPFDGPSIPAIYDRIVHQDPPAISGDLGAVVAKALEKEPGRRYAEATAMADDIGRFLRGEPLSVHSSGHLGRAWRRVRRAPLRYAIWVSAVLTLSVVVVMALGGARDRAQIVESVRDQARISLQAALALRRTGSMNGMRRFLPPLETAYRVAVVRAPDLAEMDYLMGRMHRGLLDDDQALSYQDKALKKDPRFAPALYERAVLLSLREARAVVPDDDPAATGPAPVAAAKNVATEPTPRPSAARAACEAFLALGPSSGLGEAPDLLVRGLRAFQQGDNARARVEIEHAIKIDATLEEAWEALGHAVRADRRPSAEHIERRSAETEALLTARIENDRGYLPHLLARAQLRIDRSHGRRYQGRDPLPDLRAADEDFSEALRLDPRSVAALTGRGALNVNRAIWNTESKVDPRPACTAAEEDLAKAVALDASDAGPWLWRGAAEFYRGLYLAETNEQSLSALNAFEVAERHLSAALRLDPRSLDALKWRGRVRAQLAAALGRAGKDPTPVFESAEQDFVASTSPRRDSFAWIWRSTVFGEWAIYKIGRKENPEPEFARARSHLDHALSFQQQQWDVWNHRGLLHWQRGRYLEAKSQKTAAREAYAAAAADLHQAVSLNPHAGVRLESVLNDARRRAGDL